MKEFFNKINLNTLLLIAVLIVSLLNIVKNRDDSVNKEDLQTVISTLSNRIDSVQLSITVKIDSINRIEQHKTFIKNYFEQKANEVDSVKSDNYLYDIIRFQLLRLGSARFN